MSDISCSNESDKKKHFLSRALVAVAIMKDNGVDEATACKYITDGGNDYGLDGIFINHKKKNITFIQSKYHEKGTKTIGSGDLHNFFEGIKKIISSDYDGFNSKIFHN